MFDFHTGILFPLSLLRIKKSGSSAKMCLSTIIININFNTSISANKHRNDKALLLNH